MFGKIKKLYFIGIGGAGMSGIAEILLNLGYKIKGCQNISVIIGNEDNVVDPNKTFDWLIKNKPTVNVKLIDGMGHRFNISTFIGFAEPIISKII